MNPGVRPGAALAALLLLQFGTPGLRAERVQPPLPQSPPEHRDPDPSTCRRDSIRQHFQAQLNPWKDQPPAVLASLRTLQAEMALATLRRCVQRGLMPRDEALQLARELDLMPPTRP